MPKRVSLRGKGADLFFGDYAPEEGAPAEGDEAASEPAARSEGRDHPTTALESAAAHPSRATPGATERAVRTARLQVHKSTSTQAGKRIRGRVEEPAQPLVVKYTTHLRPETIRALKRVAFESERKDYEIVQEALDAYLKQQPRS